MEEKIETKKKDKGAGNKIGAFLGIVGLVATVLIGGKK